MKKYTAVLLMALTIIITVAADTASAADNVRSMTNGHDDVDTGYKLKSWSNEYPVIDLFGEKYVPLFTANGNTENIHVNKLAKLLRDSGENSILKEGEKLDLGNGYVLEVKQISVDEMKVWLEFSKDGQHIADKLVSINTEDNNTWTVALDNVQGENNIVVMRVHISDIFVGTEINVLKIDGIWLIDYASAKTLKVGDKIGDFKLEKIVNGENTSKLGSLVFENTTGSTVTCNVAGTSYECNSWSDIAADTANAADNISTSDIEDAEDTVNTAGNVSSTTNVCDVVGANYKWGSNEQYPVIDLFGEKDIPLFTTNGNIWDAHANKLAKLIIDSNEPHFLNDGEKLELGNGYALEAKQINIYNREAWLEFTKDGQHVADKIVSSLSDENRTWTVALDNVQGESNITVMRVHIDDIGGLVENNIVEHSSVTIDGIWLTDYANARTLEIGDQIGEFKLEKIASGTNISNHGSLVFENATGSAVTCNVVGTKYKCDSWSNKQYPLINLFGEKEVPLFADNDPIWKCHVDKLAKLVLDSDEKHTLKTGENLELGQGYSLKVNEIDVDGKRAWIEFDKNGQKVDDAIILTDPGHDLGDQNWTYFRDQIQGEYNIPVLKVYLRDVYQSANDSIVQINGLWLIDYENATTLKIGDKIGEYTLEKIVSGTNSSNLGSLVFKKTQAVDFSSSDFENKSVISTTRSSKSPIAWYWDFWRFLAIKDR